MGFGPRRDVLVKAIDDSDWELLVALDYRGKTEQFVVPAEMSTDFASVPRVFVWFLPRYGRYTKAAVLHDYLWRRLARTGAIRWVDADAIFRRAMRELKVPFLRRWILWAAVRWGAIVKKGGWEGWWKESWRVFLVTLLALPIVAPPAAVILVALFAFFLLELLVWLPLRLARFFRVRVMKQPAPKEVNMPRFRWKTA
jgi:hypothetical protein